MNGAQWMVVDSVGAAHWPPEPRDNGVSFVCAGVRDTGCLTQRQAVLAWALAQRIDAAEIVAPGDLSAASRERTMWARCVKACEGVVQENSDLDFEDVAAGAQECVEAVKALAAPEAGE